MGGSESLPQRASWRIPQLAGWFPSAPGDFWLFAHSTFYIRTSFVCTIYPYGKAPTCFLYLNLNLKNTSPTTYSKPGKKPLLPTRKKDRIGYSFVPLDNNHNHDENKIQLYYRIL